MGRTRRSYLAAWTAAAVALAGCSGGTDESGTAARSDTTARQATGTTAAPTSTRATTASPAPSTTDGSPTEDRRTTAAPAGTTATEPGDSDDSGDDSDAPRCSGGERSGRSAQIVGCRVRELLEWT